MTTNAKPSWGHVWTSTENDVFWFKKNVAPSTQALEIENFKLQRTIENLAEFLKKVVFETYGSYHSSTMNFCREHDSH